MRPSTVFVVFFLCLVVVLPCSVFGQTTETFSSVSPNGVAVEYLSDLSSGPALALWAPSGIEWAEWELLKLQELDSNGSVVAAAEGFRNLDWRWVHQPNNSFDPSAYAVNLVIPQVNITPLNTAKPFTVQFNLETFFVSNNFSTVVDNSTAIDVKPGQLKWQLSVSGWQFQSRQNKLRFGIQLRSWADFVGAAPPAPSNSTNTTISPTGSTTSGPANQTTSSPFNSTTSAPFNSTTSSPLNSTTSSPLNGTTSSPLNSTTSAPLNGTTSSPLNGTTSSPLNGTTSSPLNGTTSAPLNGTTSSPLNGTTSPLNSTSSAPVNGTTSAPSNGTTTAPVNGTTSSPVNGTTSSPFNSTTSAPSNGTTSSPSNSTTSSPFNSTTSPFNGTTTSPSNFTTSSPSNSSTNSTTIPTTIPFTTSSPFNISAPFTFIRSVRGLNNTAAIIFARDTANILAPTVAVVDGNVTYNVSINVTSSPGLLEVDWDFPAFNQSLEYDPVMAVTDLLPLSSISPNATNSTLPTVIKRILHRK